MDGSSNAIEFELSKIGSRYDLETDDGKVGYLKAANLLASIYNPIERDVYAPRQLMIWEFPKTFLLQIKSVIKQKATKEEKRKDTLKIAAAEPIGAPPDPEQVGT